jgi:cytochrome c oxidase assembly protein subunit 11
MPVFFYIDPEFASDPRLKGVENLTLSYTFFEVEEGQPLPQLPQPGVAMTGPIPQ